METSSKLKRLIVSGRRRHAGRWASAIVVLLMPMGGVATVVQADPAETAVLTNPDQRPSLESLVREGLEHSADGDLEAAVRSWAQIREHYPDHPAAPVFEIHTLNTRRSLDHQDPQYDKEIGRRADEAVKLSEAWIKRAPDDALAHFYAGQAKFAQMMLAGLQGRYYRAGTRGEEAREHLERAIELDPELVDAKMPLGSYYYWASMATRFIKWLTWLWFVPTGNHDLALEYVDEVRREGDLFRFDAAVQLAEFYMYFEGTPERAAPILEELHAAHPDNTYIDFEIAELRMLEEDWDGTIEAALAVEQTTGTQFGDAIRRWMAKIWRARAELMRGNPEPVGPILESLDAQWDELTPWGKRWLVLTRANLQDLEGRRKEAVESYEQVIAMRARWESGRAVSLAREGLETPFRPAVATMTAR